MNLIPKNQHIFGLKKKNFKFKIDCMQPFSIMAKNDFNKFYQTQTQNIILFQNRVKELKMVSGLIDLSRRFLSSVPTKEIASITAPELAIVHHKDGKNLFSKINPKI